MLLKLLTICSKRKSNYHSNCTYQT